MRMVGNNQRTRWFPEQQQPGVSELESELRIIPLKHVFEFVIQTLVGSAPAVRALRAPILCCVFTNRRLTTWLFWPVRRTSS